MPATSTVADRSYDDFPGYEAQRTDFNTSESLFSENQTGADWSDTYIRQVRKAREERFERLAEAWWEDTLFESSVTRMAMHPAYQRIIGMGESAVPLMLEALAEEPEHWFWALRAITGEDPVSEDDRGDVRAMTAAWLEWGRAQGYR